MENNFIPYNQDLTIWPNSSIRLHMYYQSLLAPEPETKVKRKRVINTSPEFWEMKERFFSLPPDMRVGIDELSHLLGQTKNWIYKRTYVNSKNPIPFSKDGKILWFLIGEVREWYTKTSKQKTQCYLYERGSSKRK